MLQNLLPNKLNSCSVSWGASNSISNLIFLALGVSATLTATLTITSPASAQNSTVIYQRTTTYDNYHDNKPTVIYQNIRHDRDRKPYRTNYIYGNPIPTTVLVNPHNGQIIQRSNNFYPHSYPQRRIIIQPRMRRYIKNSTLVNPILVNPNIRRSTIINPRILNPHRHYYGNPIHRNSTTIFIKP
jgi:hypothetical protein